jgi:hypothetical protein
MAISVEDQLAILDLCSRYNYHIDTGKGEAWADTFTADGIFDGAGQNPIGRAALVDFGNSFSTQYPGCMHFTDNHLFDEHSDHVEHKCFLSFQVPDESGKVVITLVGYTDKVVKQDGAWLFQERVVAPIS